MTTKLFIGNLSFNMTDKSLEEMFSKAGKVISAKVIMDKMSGRSRGFAFVEMETEDAAKAAIEQFNTKDVDGRQISVSEARPKA